LGRCALLVRQLLAGYWIDIAWAAPLRVALRKAAVLSLNRRQQLLPLGGLLGARAAELDEHLRHHSQHRFLSIGSSLSDLVEADLTRGLFLQRFSILAYQKPQPFQVRRHAQR